MRRALGLSAFVLAVLSPFLAEINITITALSVLIAFCVWIYLRNKEPQIDMVQLQAELDGHVRELNRDF